MLQSSTPLQGMVERFVTDIKTFLSKETEKWVHRALCNHDPVVFTGRLPLTPEECAYIQTRCNISVGPVTLTDGEWSLTELRVDGVMIAQIRARFSTSLVRIVYNCAGKVT